MPDVGYVDVLFASDRMNVRITIPKNLRSKIFCEYECMEPPLEDNCDAQSGDDCPCRFVYGKTYARYAEVYQREELRSVLCESAIIYLPLGFDSIDNPDVTIATLTVSKNTQNSDTNWQMTYDNKVSPAYDPLTDQQLKPHQSLEDSSNG